MPQQAKSKVTDRKANSLVRLENVDVTIAGRPVLHGVNWVLYPGSHWGIVGANGSGKSTFLALVAGVVWPAPNCGRRVYNFGDADFGDAVEARERVALVGHELQDRYARWAWNFTALQVVLSGVFKTDVPRRRATAAEREKALGMLAELGLGELAERRFLELSRGEQRRVLIARCMASEPTILLLDEPGSGLDRPARIRLGELIETVAQSTTVVTAGHGYEDVAPAATEFIELEAGKIARVGPRPALRPRRGPPEPATAARPAAAHVPDREAGPPALIEVDNADIWLAGRRVLRGLNWRLHRDEHWLVAGVNGAGKSTFLKLLHGQLRPALGGRISWPALANPRNVWALRRQIGYVSAELQAAYRYPTRVRDCVASGFESSIGLTRGTSPAEAQRVAELLDRFELEPLADRYLSTLSYGQRHRVLIARTMVGRPRILLLDEPWEGLDEPTRALLARELERAMADGTQIVCVSHVAERRLPLTHELRLRGGRIMRGDGRIEPRENSSSAR